MNFLFTLRCRAVQAMDSLRDNTEKKKDVMHLREPGSLARMAELLARAGAKKPLVLVPEGGAPGKELLLSLLESDLPEFVVWEMPAESSEKDAENIRLYYIGARCDSFIALGGEKQLQAAKMIAARTAHPRKTLPELVKKGLQRRLPPLLAIPTELGGAAASARAELGGLSLRDGRLCPRLYIQDALLLPPMEKQEQARQGMELLCRCVEALVSPGSKDRRPRLLLAAESLLGALEALAAGGDIRECLFRHSIDLADIEGGYAWALSRAIGEQTLMKAGTAAAVCLPGILELYGKKNGEIPALLDSLSPEQEEETDREAEEAPAKDLLWRLRRLAWDLGLPESYEALNFDVEIKLAQRAAELANPHWNCPVVWQWKDLRDALRSLKA